MTSTTELTSSVVSSGRGRRSRSVEQQQGKPGYRR